MANGESVVEHATHGPDVNGAKLTLEDPAIKVGSRWDQGGIKVGKETPFGL